MKSSANNALICTDAQFRTGDKACIISVFKTKIRENSIFKFRITKGVYRFLYPRAESIYSSKSRIKEKKSMQIYQSVFLHHWCSINYFLVKQSSTFHRCTGRCDTGKKMLPHPENPGENLYCDVILPKHLLLVGEPRAHAPWSMHGWGWNVPWGDLVQARCFPF